MQNTDHNPHEVGFFTVSFPPESLPESFVYNCDLPCLIEQPQKEDIAVIQRNSFTFTEFYDILVNGHGTPVSEGKLHILYTLCSNKYGPNDYTVETILPSIYQFTIGGLNPSHDVFGHFLLDWFIFLQLLPKSVVQASDFVFSKNCTYASHILSLLDVDPKHIHLMDATDCVRIRRFIALTPNQCLTGNLVLYTRLREVLIKKDIQPFRYVVYNRPPSKKRTVSNVLDVLEELQDGIENNVFVMISDFKTPEEGFSYYEEIKVLFTVHGSVLTNLITMKSGSIVCDYQTQRRFWIFEYLARCFGIKYVFIGDKTIKHYAKYTYIEREYLEKIVTFVKKKFL